MTIARSLRAFAAAALPGVASFAIAAPAAVQTGSDPLRGSTSRYQGPEASDAKYGAKGLVVPGFLSNDFEQEPDNDWRRSDFWFDTRGVNVSMASVIGKGANPLHVDLARLSHRRPEWNFRADLLDRTGEPVDRFASVVSPTDRRVVSGIERRLDA